MATTEEMKTAILKAVKAGLSKAKIDVSGKGSAVKRLEEGGKPKEEKIVEMYQAVCARQPESQSITKPITPITQEEGTMETLLRENEELKARVANLEREVEALKKPITDSITKKPITESITKSITEKPKGCNILGFSLTFNAKDAKWYGVKRIGNKQVSIYIGKLEDAESKIRAYCEKKGIERESNHGRT